MTRQGTGRREPGTVALLAFVLGAVAGVAALVAIVLEGDRRDGRRLG